MSKKIRDPIYDYIVIEDGFLPIINSVEFQRLRDVIQTSYTSIYPSALHNRFTHSLGVFWLGNIAFEALLNNSPKETKALSKKDKEDTNTIYTLVYMSAGWEWLKIMDGNEDTLLSFLFPESYLKQEYEDNAYVNINKLLNSINDKHTQDEIRLLIGGISDKLTIGSINEEM